MDDGRGWGMHLPVEGFKVGRRTAVSIRGLR